MSNDQSPAESRTPRRHTAGAFDIRNIIGALLTIYGVILLLVHFISGSDNATGGQTQDQANLWTGLVLLVVGITFFVWNAMNPTVVDEDELEQLKEEKREMGAPGAGSTSD